jgi:hypothetical protein
MAKAVVFRTHMLKCRSNGKAEINVVTRWVNLQLHFQWFCNYVGDMSSFTITKQACRALYTRFSVTLTSTQLEWQQKHIHNNGAHINETITSCRHIVYGYTSSTKIIENKQFPFNLYNSNHFIKQPTINQTDHYSYPW